MEKTLWKVNFSYYSIIYLIFWFNTGKCCEHVTGGVNIYLYGCVSLLALEFALCVFVFVCVISNQSTSKKPHYLADLSKLDALLHKTHIKFLLVLRYQGLICVDPYYYVAWSHNQPKKQNYRKDSGSGRLEVTGKFREGEGWSKVEKRVVGNIGEG